MLQLARKAFAPAPVPFPIMHVDTGHNFPEVIEFRDKVVDQYGLRLEVASVQDLIDDGGSSKSATNWNRATATRPAPCSMRSRTAASTPSSAAVGATRTRPAPRSGCSPSATNSASGTRRASGPSSGASTTAATARASTSASSRSPTGPSSTSGATWRAEQIELPPIYFAHEREVVDNEGLLMAVNEYFPLPEGAEVARRDGPLPDRRRRHPDRRRPLAGDRLRVGDRGDVGLADHRARRHPRRRPLLRSGDGGSQAGGLLLVAEMLRIATAGSVDDGKSTLIGRLLHDTKAIFEDQLEAIERTSEKRGDEQTDLALLTDGLRAEREQGITIDVAYRYFATPKRKFVIADTPGHIQYTRNMVTGASTANLALLLIDARKGVLEQTRRHALLSSLLGVPHLVLCVNKMDLVDYDERIYEEIRDEFSQFAAKLDITDLGFVPISALQGDNVVDRSTNMPWFDGQPLLGHLEDVHIASDRNLVDNRFPVQYVIRPQSAENRDYRGFAGSVVGGIFKQGDEVMVMPSRKILEGRRDRHARRRGRPGLPADGGDAATGGRRRRLARRHDLPPDQPADREPADRGDGLLVRRDLAPAHRRRLPAEAHHPLGRRRGRGAALPARRRHPAPRPRRGDARGQRHRPGRDPHHLAALLRRVPAEPDHRQLHPGRSGDRPHGRRRDDQTARRTRSASGPPTAPRSSPRTSPSTRASSPARTAGARWKPRARRSG